MQWNSSRMLFHIPQDELKGWRKLPWNTLRYSLIFSLIPPLFIGEYCRAINLQTSWTKSQQTLSRYSVTTWKVQPWKYCFAGQNIALWFFTGQKSFRICLYLSHTPHFPTFLDVVLCCCTISFYHIACVIIAVWKCSNYFMVAKDSNIL